MHPCKDDDFAVDWRLECMNLQIGGKTEWKDLCLDRVVWTQS